MKKNKIFKNQQGCMNMIPDATRKQLVLKKNKSQNRFVISLLLSFIFLAFAPNSGLGSVACCISIPLLLSYDSAYRTLKKYDKRVKVIIAQQPPSQIIQNHHYHQQPIQQQPVQQNQIQQNELSPEFKLNYAKNLEKARNFEKAADAYFELGLFEESARIRQTYLEKDTSTTVNIGKVGDTHINDSVVMNEQSAITTTRTCPFCQQDIESHWATCPFCTKPF
jgi:hypothetical protein